MYWFLFLLSLATPFWETKAPADWSDIEIASLLTDSPWAQMVVTPGKNSAPPIQVYLATATPIEQAEQERNLRAERKRSPNAKPVEDQFAEEYRAWLEDNRATQIVVAVRITNNKGFFDEKEMRSMEQESVMHVGRKKFKMTGHFPPSASDPYLRMAFPREVTAGDKTVSFDLSLPGVEMPFRQIEFKVKDLMLRGKLEI
jgi:hypothetical protein